MLLGNLLAARMKIFHKLHKTKRKLSESPGINIANILECGATGCALPTRHWLHYIRCDVPLALHWVVQVPLLLVDPAAWALQARFLHRPDQKSILAVGREKESPIDLEVDSVLLHHLDGLEDVEGDLLLERNLELEDDR